MLPQKTIKHINKLQQKKYRKEFEEFTVEGIKGVEEALRSNAEIILVLIEGNRRDEKNIIEIIKLAEKNDVQVEYLARKDVEEIKTTDTFPGVTAVVSRLNIAPEDIVNSHPIICLDGIKDPGNLGTIIRTADWFGIKNILLSEDCVDPYNPKVVRSTMGSIFHVKIFESYNLQKNIKTIKQKNKYIVRAFDLNGKSIDKIKPVKNAIYVFGSESHGFRHELEELIDERYTIQGNSNNTESLNVAVAVGIIINKIK